LQVQNPEKVHMLNANKKPEFLADLEQLKAAARRGDWAYVDENIGQLGGDDGHRWAFGTGLDDPNPNIRDLAATLLGMAAFPFTSTETDKLYQKMKTDDSLVVRARCAFAMVIRHDQSDLVLKIIREARDADDPELAVVANGYWKRYIQPFL
jgi:hypothetical protein